MDSLDEMLQFLTLEARLDVKVLAVEYVLGMTGKEDGRKLLNNKSNVLVHLAKLVKDKSPGIARDACLALVNISADEDGALALLHQTEHCGEDLNSSVKDIISVMVEMALDPVSHLADPALMILCNLTRPAQLTGKVLSVMIGEDGAEIFDEDKLSAITERIITALTSTKYNSHGANMNYLGPLLSNLSQLSAVRRFILNHERGVVHRLFPFTEYQDSHVRRGGIVGTLRNCCFEVEEHSWLLSPEVDILPRLLLPLAGPEEFDDEDNGKLPIDLQWLPEDKRREEDPDIRRMLLESLQQLCATRQHREYLRDHNVYVILRELHKWEKDREALLACENLVDLLIRTEEEIGSDNLHKVEIPEDLPEKFRKMDEDFLKDE